MKESEDGYLTSMKESNEHCQKAGLERLLESQKDHQTTKKEQKNEKHYVDGGYLAWLVVASCFTLCVISDGIFASIGIFYVEIVSKFDASSTEAASIISLMSLSYFLFGPVTGMMVSTVGARVAAIVGSYLIALGFLISAFAPSLNVLCLSLGILTGTGVGMIYQIAAMTVNFYFLRRRGIACGIVGCGSGAGIFIFPSMINYLLTNYGLHGTFLVLAGVALQGVICGVVLIPPKQLLKIKIHNARQTDPESFLFIQKPDSKLTETEEGFTTTEQTTNSLCVRLRIAMRKQLQNIKILKSGTFVLLAVSQFFFNYGLPVPFMFIPDRALSYGMSKERSSFLVSIAGISSILSKFVCGPLADMKWAVGRRVYILAVSLIICGTATFLNIGTSFALQALYTSIFGFCIGAIFCLCCLTIADLLGVENLTTAYGMTNFISAFASLLGPYVAGWTLNKTNSYTYIFGTAGGSFTLAGVTLLLIPCIITRNGETQPCDNISESISADSKLQDM